MGELGEEWSSNRELPTPILGPEVHGLWSKKKKKKKKTFTEKHYTGN